MSGSRVKSLGIIVAFFAGLPFAAYAGPGTPITQRPITPRSVTPRPVTLGETRYFKNWAAGCDNTLSCQAIAMQPAETGDGESKGYLTLSYTTDNEAAGASIIEITGMDADISKYRILSGKRLIISGTLKGSNDSITITGRDSRRLAQEIPNGQELHITDAAGKSIGRVSLTGSAAALKYIKSKQKKYGRPLPVVVATRTGKEAAIPDTGALVALAESGNCSKLREGVTEDTAYSLGTSDGTARALALISCGNGAYNFNSAAFVGKQGNDGTWKFEPAQYDYASTDKNTALDNNTGAAQKLLTNATWDAGTQTLSSYYKGRVIADCGATEDYVWDGTMFRLTRAERMDKCQGASAWITLWRAAVKFTS
jgi:Protein of unknown function (DUF1176)